MFSRYQGWWTSILDPGRAREPITTSYPASIFSISRGSSSSMGVERSASVISRRRPRAASIPASRRGPCRGSRPFAQDERA
jgi:hypothetical protein